MDKGELKAKLDAVTSQWFTTRSAWEQTGRRPGTPEAQAFAFVNRELLELRAEKEALEQAPQRAMAKAQAQTQERERSRKLLVAEGLLTPDEAAKLNDDDYEHPSFRELVARIDQERRRRQENQAQRLRRIEAQRHAVVESRPIRPRIGSGKTCRNRLRKQAKREQPS